ncbi:hypothetical protein EVAR_23704_1 [Eumeta japonica]|uniref:Uncharacterized protein n=1 Tax=Eumeta variegata TaxID=151549 RepID=A0A4C1VFL9_EUMVA|nr:hypothetical protein EVAR_23704_1 [Eumeta japonica]
MIINGNDHTPICVVNEDVEMWYLKEKYEIFFDQGNATASVTMDVITPATAGRHGRLKALYENEGCVCLCKQANGLVEEDRKRISEIRKCVAPPPAEFYYRRKRVEKEMGGNRGEGAISRYAARKIDGRRRKPGRGANRRAAPRARACLRRMGRERAREYFIGTCRLPPPPAAPRRAVPVTSARETAACEILFLQQSEMGLAYSEHGCFEKYLYRIIRKELLTERYYCNGYLEDMIKTKKEHGPDVRSEGCPFPADYCGKDDRKEKGKQDPKSLPEDLHRARRPKLLDRCQKHLWFHLHVNYCIVSLPIWCALPSRHPSRPGPRAGPRPARALRHNFIDLAAFAFKAREYENRNVIEGISRFGSTFYE